MLTISEGQMTRLRGALWQTLKAALADQIRLDHPEKARGVDVRALEQHVELLIGFAARYQLERIPSFHKVVSIQMRTGFHPDRLTPGQRHPLESFALDEDDRLARFEQACLGVPAPLTVIDLDTPIARAPRHGR